MSRASDLARGLGARAEAVCRHYLSNGRRQGRYWIVGDVHNTPGGSLYVRLIGDRAGQWTDAATSEHGDLLDLIAMNRGLAFRATLDEARHFLGQPWSEPERLPPARQGSSEAACRLFAASVPIRGTLAERYLARRGILLPDPLDALRFHPRCYRRGPSGRESGPALIAAVTDLGGRITGLHRTFLDPDGGKAAIEHPRRAMGFLLGQAVRFGPVTHVLVAAEGLETALSLKLGMPGLPVAAALSSAHLAALIWPRSLRRLYVAIDRDRAGSLAWDRLRERARAVGIDCRPLVPRAKDFNADLLTLGPDRLRSWLAEQLAEEETAACLHPCGVDTGGGEGGAGKATASPWSERGRAPALSRG
ncbi:toprim domain-containing protein [Rhodospirillum sp. A1_3_36]|uniref:DUF7146 domain-containing protein n=1 Tax=Rhodospirillum sp. A1_3_36 TaxID=3391666 RepID=UPI0039A40621